MEQTTQGTNSRSTSKSGLRLAPLLVEDCGAFSLDSGDDYNEFVFRVAEHIAQSDVDRGIIFGGSGQGEAMQANRVQGVRAGSVLRR